jgi:hypothetical protein
MFFEFAMYKYTKFELYNSLNLLNNSLKHISLFYKSKWCKSIIKGEAKNIYGFIDDYSRIAWAELVTV